MKQLSLIFCAMLLCGVPTASAQMWANKMFEATDHDFGVVARNSKQQFRFKLKNIYVEDVHIARVRSSCGCTSPIIEKRTLKTHESGTILTVLRRSPVKRTGIYSQRRGLQPGLHPVW